MKFQNDLKKKLPSTGEMLEDDSLHNQKAYMNVTTGRLKIHIY